mmetsp:Transcript_4037/g.12132  ORF Transcript_4037/g.12132 Transcript_4037/m.12132 type:complete len:219 (+) Transcript_4037:2697-3353(+)
MYGIVDATLHVFKDVVGASTDNEGSYAGAFLLLPEYGTLGGANFLHTHGVTRSNLVWRRWSKPRQSNALAGSCNPAHLVLGRALDHHHIVLLQKMARDLTKLGAYNYIHALVNNAFHLGLEVGLLAFVVFHELLCRCQQHGTLRLCLLALKVARIYRDLCVANVLDSSLCVTCEHSSTNDQRIAHRSTRNLGNANVLHSKRIYIGRQDGNTRLCNEWC